MNKSKFTLLTASFIFALAFTISCSSDGGGGGSEVSSNESSGSSSELGENPELEYQDFSCGTIPFFIDKRDNKEYHYIKAGSNYWMLYNLNYSENNKKGWCQGADLSKIREHADMTSCETFGRFYDWATLMNFPVECNAKSSDSDSQCEIKTQHQGVCPKGWHVPSKEDWEDLRGIDFSIMQLENAGNYGTNSKWQLGWKDLGKTFLMVAAEGTIKSTEVYVALIEENNTFLSNPFSLLSDAWKTDLFPVRCVADKETELPACSE